MRWLLSAILLIFAGVCNGIMDSLQFHFGQTIFANATDFDPNFWDPAISWKNKYLDLDPAKGEAFFGSSTFLVFTTDAWHLAKFLMLKCFVLAVLCFGFGEKLELEDWQKLVVGFVGLTLCYQLGFWLAFV